MKKAIYIHGLGGSGEGSSAKNVRRMLENTYELKANTYDLLKPEEAFRKIREDIKDVDLIIASSLGAFYASALQTDKNVILLNPCLMPEECIEGILYEEQKALFNKEECITSWKKLKENWKSKNKESYTNYAGIFSDKDELFHYKDVYDKNFGCSSKENSKMISGYHEIAKNDNQLQSALREAFLILNLV